MNLVKWFRKNNTKIMAVVVIILMFAFVGGSSLTYLLQSRGGMNETIAYFGENIKITRQDIRTASSELDILRMVGANEILRILQVPLFNNLPDLHPFLLGELLFSDQKISPASVNNLKQIIRYNQYRIQFLISDQQINDMYKQTVPGTIYWLCLKNEAQRAGIRAQNEDAGNMLGQAIPIVFNGMTYSQVIGSIIKQYGIPEQQILTTVAHLLAILQYSHWICSGEDITIRQIMQTMAREEESIEAEFVEFKSSVFAETQEPPDEEQIIEHFEKYRKNFSGEISDDNPYGFGYKLPDMVQLEYIAVRPDDVAEIIEPVSQDELEEFYERYKKQLFTKEQSPDPNNPNPSPKVTPYSEVAGMISKQLTQDKIQTKTESIIKEAISLTETSLQDMNDTEISNLSSEEFAKLAGDYKAAAENLRQKHNVKIYSGRTGLIGPLEMQNDEHLAPLYIQNYGYNPITLTQAVFAIDELAACEIGLTEGQAPKMYQNIGPVKDQREQSNPSEQIMAVVRVIKAVKASEPNSIDYTFNTNSFIFDLNQENSEENVFSVKEKVVEDLKNLAALETAKNAAEEFIKTAASDDWEKAVEKLNEIYGQEENNEPNDPNSPETTAKEDEQDIEKPFRVENFPALRRLSKALLETLAIQDKNNPAAQFFINENAKGAQLADLLFSLAPQDSNDIDTFPAVVEFKPDMSYFAIKNISPKKLWKEDFEQNKAKRLYTEDFIQSQSLAIVHFNPENILRRMNFRPIETEEDTTESDTPEESEAAL